MRTYEIFSSAVGMPSSASRLYKFLYTEWANAKLTEALVIQFKVARAYMDAYGLDWDDLIR